MAEYCKVVIIDDEFIMRQGMKHMLDWEKEGFQIVGEASNGQEGLEVIEKTKPNIVLTDIVMPVLDGIEFSEILNKRFPEMQLVILSSYDKFEYVKATFLNGVVDYILKPTLNPEILLSTLKKVCGNQKDKIASVQESIFDFFQSKKEYVHCHVFLEEEVFCCIFNFRVKDEKLVLADIESCVDKMAKMYGNVFFVVGKSFAGMKNIKDCYQKEIKDMVNRQFYFKEKSLLVLEMPQVLEKEQRFPFADYSELLLHSRFADAIAMLKKYVFYLKERQVEEYRLKNLTKNLLYNYLMEIERYEVESEQLRQQYFNWIDNTHYIEEFVQVFQDIIEKLEALRVYQLEAEDVKISKMKKYIKEHYQEQLELSEIAENFNFNYHYLSSYFNKHTKEGFSGYLNKIRIEKACELLRKGDMSISQISAAIGYSDHSYFCRVFKKMIGNTPSSYKRQMKKE